MAKTATKSPEWSWTTLAIRYLERAIPPRAAQQSPLNFQPVEVWTHSAKSCAVFFGFCISTKELRNLAGARSNAGRIFCGTRELSQEVTSVRVSFLASELPASEPWLRLQEEHHRSTSSIGCRQAVLSLNWFNLQVLTQEAIAVDITAYFRHTSARNEQSGRCQ